MSKRINKFILFILFTSITINAISQSNTIGLLHSTISASDGYTLFTPKNNDLVYLINNCGEKVNEWIFTEQPGATCYFLENGNLLRAGKNL